MSEGRIIERTSGDYTFRYYESANMTCDIEKRLAMFIAQDLTIESTGCEP